MHVSTESSNAPLKEREKEGKRESRQPFFDLLFSIFFFFFPGLVRFSFYNRYPVQADTAFYPARVARSNSAQTILLDVTLTLFPLPESFDPSRVRVL